MTVLAKAERTFSFRVLGPVAATVDRGDVELGSPKQVSVWAMLVSRAGSAVDRDELIEGVWGEDAGDDNRRSLHTYLSNLRAVTGADITRSGTAYVLRVDRDEIDHVAFEEAVEEARSKLTTAPQEAAEHLRAALSWWRGRPYATAADTPGLQAEIRRLEELRVQAVELRIEADLAAGNHARLIPELEALVADYPLRERFRFQQMLALYRDGRQADALRAYRRAAHDLAQETGLEPSPELQNLEMRILQHDEGLLVGVGHTVTERRAFLFTDIEGSTRKWDTHPDAMGHALQRHDAILTNAVTGARGKVFKHTGDGMLAAFPSVADAVQAAEKAQRSLGNEDWGVLEELKVRMGIDYGDVDARGDDFFGPPLNRCARIMNAAHGGQVLLSLAAQEELTRNPIEGVQIRYLGEHRLRGLSDAERIGQLVFIGLPADFPELRVHIPGPDPTDPDFGDSIRGYELRERVGVGTFGVVYKAYQPSVGREVAIKVIRPEFANHPAFVRRFETEAKLVAQLEHPHIVPLFDFWRDKDGAYLVMQLMRGGTLRPLVGTSWTPPDAVRLIRQVGSALASAHRQGVVHRDLKPANVLLDDEGNAYLADFGIAARILDPAEPGSLSSSAPRYRAPEETQELPADHRSDIYSLGILTYELLTAEHVDVEHRRVTDVRPDLPETLNSVVGRATTARAADRFPTVDDFIDALTAALGDLVDLPSEPPARTEIRNPYKGLRPFLETDHGDFFGRDGLVETLTSALQRQRIVTVVGPSGSGKSSAVHAGLLPRLRAGTLPGSEDWLYVTLTPGTRPFESLARTLESVATEPVGDLVGRLARSPDALQEIAEGLLEGHGDELVVVVDQFEEVFTLVESEDERDAFLSMVAQTAEAPEARVRFVLTLRADFYDRPLHYEHIGPHVGAGQVTVIPATRSELIEAIERPAAAVGLRFEPGLAARIASDVADQPGGLPLMQYALTELVAGRDTDVLTAAGYDRIGGVTGALGRRAEQVYQDLPGDRRQASREILLRLVTVDENGDDTRRRAKRSELEALDIDRRAITDIVDVFGRHRLLSFDRDAATRSPTVEVAHESLLREWTRLRGWIDEQRGNLILGNRFRTAMAEWNAAERADDFLLTGDRLAPFAHWAATASLTAEERAFLDASREADGRAREARLRRRRVLTGVLAAATVVSLAFGAFAFVQRNQARDRAAEARAGELVAASILELDRDPELSLLLAMEANQVAPPTPESESALRQALFHHRGILTYRLDGGGIPGGDLSPNGRLLAVAGHSSGLVEMVEVDTGAVAWEYDLGDDVVIYQPFFVSDGRELVVPAFWTGSGAAPEGVGGLHVLDATSGQVVRFLEAGDCGVFEAGTRSFSDDYVYATLPGCGRDVRVISDVIRATETPTELPVVRIDLADGTVATMHDMWAFRMTASDDERRVAMTTRNDGGQVFLRVIDTGTGEALLELREDFSEQVATISPDGRQLVFEEFPSGDLIVLGLDSGREVTRYFGHGFDVTNVWFGDDGHRVYSSGRDGTFQIWDPESGETLERVSFGDAALWSAASDDLSRAAVFSGVGTVKVYDLERGGGLFGRSHDPLPLDDCGIRFNQSFGLQVVADTATFYGACIADWDGDYRVSRLGTFDLTSGEQLIKFIPSLGLHGRLSPDGSAVAGFRAGADGFTEGLEIADLASGEVIATMDGLCGINWNGEAAPDCAEYPAVPFADTGSLRFAPDGTLLAMAGSGTNAVVVWDVTTGEMIATWPAGGELLGIAFSPDGTRLLVGTSNGLTGYSTDDWSVVAERDWRGEAGTAPGQLLAYTSDPTRLVAATSDRLGASDVFVLDPESLETVGRIEQAHDGAVRMLDVSRDGHRLATAGTDGFARVWVLETLQPAAEIPISDQAVTNVQFADGDRTLLVTTQESDILVVDLESEGLLDVARARLTRTFTSTECTVHGIDPCPTLEALRAGVTTTTTIPPAIVEAAPVGPAPGSTVVADSTTAAPTTTVEPRLTDPDVCAAPGACPDFATAVRGDDGAGPLPLGSVDVVPNENRLDFLFRVCDRASCHLDAHFIDPENPRRGSAPWTAGKPFHVRHGFINPNPEPLGEGFDLALYVSRQPADGDPPEVAEAEPAGFEMGEVVGFTPDYVLRGSSDRCGPAFETQTGPETCEWFVHDFPEGLPAGRFRLWAVWEAPCSAWLDLGLADSCGDPAEVISRFSSSFDSPFWNAPPVYDHESN